jgi:hypothetical protein
VSTHDIKFAERTGYSCTAMRLLVGQGIGYKAVSDRADAALALLDPERVTSIPGIVGLYERDISGVRADVTLSDVGKQGRYQSMAASRLQNLTAAAKTVVELEAQYLTEEANAVQLPPWSETDRVEVDIALAALVREQEARSATDTKAREFINSLHRNASEQMRRAVARLPVELSGLSREQHGKVRHSLVPPSVSARLDAESKVIYAAREATQAAISYLGCQAKAEQRVLVGYFGNNWKLSGSSTPEERIARIQERLNANPDYRPSPAAP